MGIIVVPPMGVDKANYSYTFADGKPAGMYEDADHSPPNATPAVISGNNLREASVGYSGNSWALAPDPMGTKLYHATAICGNLSPGTSRGMGVVVAGSDGAGGPGATNLVFLRAQGQNTHNATLFSKVGIGSSLVQQARGTINTPMAADRTIEIEISFDGTYYTYTGFYQGSPIPGCVWQDTGGVIGVPGPSWGCGFQGQYSSGYFSSLGVYGISAYDL